MHSLHKCLVAILDINTIGWLTHMHTVKIVDALAAGTTILDGFHTCYLLVFATDLECCHYGIVISKRFAVIHVIFGIDVVGNRHN